MEQSALMDILHMFLEDEDIEKARKAAKCFLKETKPIEELCVNRVLYTKDGRKVGNGIIVDKSELHLPKLSKLFEIITDYGNVNILDESRINKLFIIGPMASSAHKNYVNIK